MGGSWELRLYHRNFRGPSVCFLFSGTTHMCSSGCCWRVARLWCDSCVGGESASWCFRVLYTLPITRVHQQFRQFSYSSWFTDSCKLLEAKKGDPKNVRPCTLSVSNSFPTHNWIVQALQTIVNYDVIL